MKRSLALEDALILDLDHLLEALGLARSVGKRVVFTNGCFDILHAGHVYLLREARRLGDLLVVGLNTDRSVHRLKGTGRPVVPQEERAEVLAAVRWVDFVVLFDQDTPLDLIRAIRPDVLVKGADYELDEIVGREEVEAAGGRVVRVHLRSGCSSSKVLERLQRRE